VFGRLTAVAADYSELHPFLGAAPGIEATT
jgi:hypothetical protein